MLAHWPKIATNSLRNSTRYQQKKKNQVNLFSHARQKHELPKFMIEQVCDTLSTKNENRIFMDTIALHPSLVSAFIGQAGANIKELQNMYVKKKRIGGPPLFDTYTLLVHNPLFKSARKTV